MEEGAEDCEVFLATATAGAYKQYAFEPTKGINKSGPESLFHRHYVFERNCLCHSNE